LFNGRKSAYGFPQRNREKSAMKTTALLIAACTLVALPMGTAGAGPCTTEIENMTKLLASRDAGAGPTTGAASSTTGQHPPNAAMGAADSSTTASSTAAESGRPQHPPTATMNQATQGGSTPSPAGSNAREQHPPTAAMNQATQGGPASPQDVQAQNRGGPTAAQQADGASRPGSENLAALHAALNEARGLDQSGKESDCMDAIQRAKRLAG
jgi:hypothetical protein